MKKMICKRCGEKIEDTKYILFQPKDCPKCSGKVVVYCDKKDCLNKKFIDWDGRRLPKWKCEKHETKNIKRT